MKIVEQIGHQGDTQWYLIDSIPNIAKKVEKQFIAASEQSGSVHALGGNYDMYEYEEGFILDVKEECILNHTFEQNIKAEDGLNKTSILPKKDHRHSLIVPGKYFVGIQRRYDPFNKLWSKVID